MKKIYRRGAVGALMDEYERAVLEYRTLVGQIPERDFTRIADAETKDEDCRSIQTITGHVVRAGYSYANYLREKFSIAAEAVPQGEVAHREAGAKLDAMLVYTVQTLDERWEMSDEEITKTVFHPRWGGTYDLEQMLEHAIVHVLRHRRQFEKMLLNFEN